MQSGLGCCCGCRPLKHHVGPSLFLASPCWRTTGAFASGVHPHRRMRCCCSLLPHLRPNPRLMAGCGRALSGAGTTPWRRRRGEARRDGFGFHDRPLAMAPIRRACRWGCFSAHSMLKRGSVSLTARASTPVELSCLPAACLAALGRRAAPRRAALRTHSGPACLPACQPAG